MDGQELTRVVACYLSTSYNTIAGGEKVKEPGQYPRPPIVILPALSWNRSDEDSRLLYTGSLPEPLQQPYELGTINYEHKVRWIFLRH